MKPLPTNQQMLTWFFLLHNKNSSIWMKMGYIGFSLINFGLLLCHVIASVVFASKFVSIDLERSLYAIYQFFCWTPIIYMFLVALHSRHKITAFIDELSKIYNASMYSNLKDNFNIFRRIRNISN